MRHTRRQRSGGRRLHRCRRHLRGEDSLVGHHMYSRHAPGHYFDEDRVGGPRLPCFVWMVSLLFGCCACASMCEKKGE